MDELMIKVLRGQANDFERHQLDRWLSESPENQAEFRALGTFWERAGEFSEREMEVPPPPPLGEILARGEQVRRRGVALKKTRAVLRSPLLGMTIAAAAVLLLFFNLGRSGPGTEPDIDRLSPVETFAGSQEVTTMGLSDGSVVRLAAGSRIEFPSVAGEREVSLEGKAFFAVASGERPFRVRTPSGEVMVTGTRFQVETAGGGLQVVVLEGLVEVAGEAGRVSVGPGQMATLVRGAPPQVGEAGDLAALLDWPGGLLIFQETPLSEVAREMEGHFGAMVEIPDGDLASRRVTAWFGDEPLEEVVSGICMVVGAQCEIRGTHVRMR